MATLLAEKYGPKAGTAASKFQAYAAIRSTQTDPTKGMFIQQRRYLLFSPGDGYGGASGFQGATFWRNWGADFRVSGNGKGDGSSAIYGDTGWVDLGWVANGVTASCNAECGYTSGSVGEQSSAATASYVVKVESSVPEAPEIVSPISGTVLSANSVGVELEWRHVPTDGSEQTKAEVEMIINDGQYQQTETANGSAQKIIVKADKAQSIAWHVRTAGASGVYGPWSNTATVNVYEVPKASVTSPQSGSLVTSMPVSVVLDFYDEKGTLANARLSVLDGDSEVFAADMGASSEYLLTAGDVALQNGKAYTFRITARSSTTLESVAESTATVSFAEPMRAELTVETDPETGYAEIALVGFSGNGDPVASTSIYRRYKGATELLAENVQQGYSFVDTEPPVNSDYQYVAITQSANGAVRESYSIARIESRWFFFDYDGKQAKGMWNPSGSIELGRPGKRRVSYAKREFPVSYDLPNRSDERQVTLLLRNKFEADAFEDLMASGGRCVYRSGDGDVIRADVEVSLRPAWRKTTYYGEVSVSIHRIDGRG